jgi:hypothetical protein
MHQLFLGAEVADTNESSDLQLYRLFCMLIVVILIMFSFKFFRYIGNYCSF